MCDQPVPQKTIDDEVSRCEPIKSSNEQVSIAIGNGTTADVTCAESCSSDAIANSNSDADSCVSSISSISERVKDTDRRRSKSGRRRSGFSRGRISLTQLSKDASGAWGGVSGSELYKQIPVDLVPAQRLSLLSRLALRHALEVLDKEFEDVPGFENFKAEGLVSIGATIDQMESDGTFEQACITSCLSPNPLNIQMDTTISELKRSINRLQQEDAAWDELVNKLEAQAQQAEQKLSQLDIAYSALPEDVKELSSSFLPSPSEMPDLAVISSEAVKDVKAISLLMDDYCHSVGLLSCANRAARKHMDCLISTLDQGSSRKMYDPKENIRQVFAS